MNEWMNQPNAKLHHHQHFTHAFIRRNRHKSIAYAPNANGISIKHHFFEENNLTKRTHFARIGRLHDWCMEIKRVIDHFAHAKHAFADITALWIKCIRADEKCGIEIDTQNSVQKSWREKSNQLFFISSASLMMVRWSSDTLYSDCAGNCPKPFSMS